MNKDFNQLIFPLLIGLGLILFVVFLYQDTYLHVGTSYNGDFYLQPINVGFQPATFFGMVGVLLIACGFYFLVRRSSDYKMLFVTMTTALLNFSVWEYFIEMSCLIYEDELNKLFGIYFSRTNMFEILGGVDVILMILIMFLFYIVYKDIRSNKQSSTYRVSAILLFVVSALSLFIKTYSKLWFFFECCITIVLFCLLIKCINQY